VDRWLGTHHEANRKCRNIYWKTRSGSVLGGEVDIEKY
jgi:hypothetical protein